MRFKGFCCDWMEKFMKDNEYCYLGIQFYKDKLVFRQINWAGECEYYEKDECSNCNKPISSMWDSD